MSRIKPEVFSQRVSKLQSRMKTEEVDCLLVYADVWHAANVAYLTDYRQGGGGIGQAWTALLLHEQGIPKHFVGFEEVGCAELQNKIDAEIIPSTQFEEVLRGIAYERNIRKIGLIGFPIVLHTVYKAVERAVNGADIIDCDLWLSEDRWVKSSEEIECIKRTFEISDKAVSLVIDAIKEGVSEKELSAIGASYLALHHCDLAFIPTVGVGANSGIAMKRSTDKCVQKGDIIMLDFGAIFEGYASDTTRNVGYYVTDSYKRGILDTVIEAREAAFAAIKPGEKISDVEHAVRNTIINRGYGDFILHNVGHGLGIDSSEEDLPIGPDSSIIMKPGMVFTVEPGIYVKDVGGCRLEECVYVTESGFESFCSLPPGYFID